MSPKNEATSSSTSNTQNPENEALNLSFNNKEVKLSAKMRLKKQRLIEIEKENSRLKNLVAAASAIESVGQNNHHFVDHEDQTSALHRLAEAAERKQVSFYNFFIRNNVFI